MSILFSSSIWNLLGISMFIIGINFFLNAKFVNNGGVKHAIKISAIFATMAFTFAVGIYKYRGFNDAFNFATAYLLEYSLSLDNVFMFILIAKALKLNDKSLEKLLKIGIIATMILRLLLIYVGSAIVDNFPMVLFAFGLILIYASFKTIQNIYIKSTLLDNNASIKMISKIIPIDYHSTTSNFFLRKNGKLYGSLAFVGLIMIISADIICAIDGISAIFAITSDPFIVYTSNLFAAVGLRAMYISLRHFSSSSKHIDFGIGLILAFIGIKLCVNIFIPDYITNANSLCFIVITILSMVFVSKIKCQKL
jgi:tellurite resistance protein TerC